MKQYLKFDFDHEAQLQEGLPGTFATPATPQEISSESSESSRGTPLTVRYATLGEGEGQQDAEMKSASCAPQEGQRNVHSDRRRDGVTSPYRPFALDAP